MMDKLIAEFPQQLQEAIDIGKNLNLTVTNKTYSNILACGLGGSGIGANLVRDLVGHQLELPMIVNKNYFIPSFVNENTFVLLNSYSGNTEETLQAMEAVAKQNATITCVTSGGKLAKEAGNFNYDLVSIPAGKPSPRACLGYSFILQMYVLAKHNFINNEFETHIQDAIKFLEDNQLNIKNEAKVLAEKLFNKITILYTPDGYESVAVRWRQQINENGKTLCWHHVIPEMNHNELVGWRTENENLAVIFFDYDDVYERTKIRKSINKTIVSKYTSNVFEIEAIGKNRFEQSLYSINLGDWVSYYISELRKVDAVEVDVIDFLKSELAKH